MHQRQIKFLILTNNPKYTPADLAHRLQRLGLNVPASHLYTSVIRTALRFLGEAVLVLSGSTRRDMVNRFPYRPTRIVDSVADLELDG